MGSKKGQLVKIQAGATPTPRRRDSGDGSILAALNPLGKIGAIVSEILDYRREIKALELEAKRIEAEAALRHHQIDAVLSLAMQQLAHKARHAREFLAFASVELSRSRIERKKVIDALARLSSFITEKEATPDALKAAQMAIPELSRLLTEQMQHSRISFDAMASVTMASLEESPTLRKVLALPAE